MRSILLAFALTAAAGAAHAEDAVLRQAAELPGYVMFAESGAPGLVLAVVRGDEVSSWLRRNRKGQRAEPDGNSLVRLNSITKAFTTEVLASLLAEGKLSLTDTLEHAAGGKAPAFDGRQITLLDLATHSAGLPREMGKAPEGVMPRAWPTRAERWSWISDLQTALGAGHRRGLFQY